MSVLTYARLDTIVGMSDTDKPLVWLHGEVKSPPFSSSARRGAGFLLRMLQCGESLSMPQSRPFPVVGRRCHELRINDKDETWRIVYRVDADAIVILAVFSKKSGKTPKAIVEACRDRLRRYESVRGV